MIILFPGRFDRPHIGHFITIQRLTKKYDKVIVVILGFEGERYSLHYRYQVMKECIDACYGNVEVVINDKDWRSVLTGVTIEDCRKLISRYNFDVYGTGNHKFLKVMEEAGCKVHFVERAYDYNATDDRLAQDVKSVLGIG